ncbi:hypothetical protein ACIQ34_04780 [Ureibacillus sp. NPDC094379]
MIGTPIGLQFFVFTGLRAGIRNIGATFQNYVREYSFRPDMYLLRPFKYLIGPDTFPISPSKASFMSTN